MNRRDFLARLTGGAVGLVVGQEIDWERLLWTPKPMIVVPAMPMRMVISTNAEFTFGFSGFVPADCEAMGQILFTGQPVLTGANALQVIKRLRDDRQHAVRQQYSHL